MPFLLTRGPPGRIRDHQLFLKSLDRFGIYFLPLLNLNPSSNLKMFPNHFQLWTSLVSTATASRASPNLRPYLCLVPVEMSRPTQWKVLIIMPGAGQLELLQESSTAVLHHLELYLGTEPHLEMCLCLLLLCLDIFFVRTQMNGCCMLLPLGHVTVGHDDQGEDDDD